MSDFVCPEGARLIPLRGKNAAGRVAIVDAEDYDRLIAYKWRANTPHYPYAIRDRSRLEAPGPRAVLMHREIMNAPAGFVVDHINHNTLDNRKENLRVCEKRQNHFNAKLSKNNTSGYKGVRKSGKKWYASISPAGMKPVHRGGFASKHDAARAYNELALLYFGEFAGLNVIDESMDPEIDISRKKCNQALSDQQVREVRERLSRDEGHTSIARKYGVSKSVIRNIAIGRTYVYVV